MNLTGGNVVTEILIQYYQDSDVFIEASCIFYSCGLTQSVSLEISPLSALYPLKDLSLCFFL